MQRDAAFFRAEWERVIGDADWFDRPMRWAQLTLVENDPGRYDPAFWLDYFRQIQADSACLSAGGCVAYYPTQVPWHHRSAWMGAQDDPFGELVAGCRALDMVVIGRNDPHAILDDAAQAHPEWVAVQADGSPRRHWAAADHWVTCALGPHAEEQMTAIHREIMARYWVDGVFGNRWAGHGICYCAYCRAAFRAASGMELPAVADARHDDYAAWLAWREDRLFALWDLWDAVIREINPQARYIPNTGGGALSSLDMARTGARADILFADRQARSGVMPIWAAGMSAKEYRAAMDDKPVGGIFSVGVEERYRWKDSVQSAPEVRLWAADATANGARPWFTKFAGVLHDRRWLPVVQEIYAWHARNERYLRNTGSLASVGLVYSQQTGRGYGAEARTWAEEPILGWYHALVEARIPFDMLHDRRLDAAHLARFKALILPNIACLSDAQCEQLRAYCAAGGSLIATYETSLYDERGRRRDDLGLADLFGASAAGPVEGPMQNAYLHLSAEARQAHPLFAGLRDAERIIHGVHRLPTRAHDAAQPPLLTLVPSYPDLPMEQLFPRVESTDQPEMHVRERGAARVLYLPWDIDRTYWEILNADHGALLGNAAAWAAGELPVTVQGPGILDVALWRQERSLTVHMVNLTNPYMLKGPMRQVCPVGEQCIRLRLPEGCAVGDVRLLGGGTLGPMQVADGVLDATISGVAEHEVLAVDLA